jgi:hypothetical protein
MCQSTDGTGSSSKGSCVAVASNLIMRMEQVAAAGRHSKAALLAGKVSNAGVKLLSSGTDCTQYVH